MIYNENLITIVSKGLRPSSLFFCILGILSFLMALAIGIPLLISKTTEYEKDENSSFLICFAILCLLLTLLSIIGCNKTADIVTISINPKATIEEVTKDFRLERYNAKNDTWTATYIKKYEDYLPKD